MKFVPSQEYKVLLRQANALNSLVGSMEKELSVLREKVKSTDSYALERLKAELESEREMNAVLTGELAALTDKELRVKER